MSLTLPRSYTLLLILIIGALSIASLLPPTRVQSLTQTVSFKDSIVISGLNNPTAVRFSRDGRVFVAEKSGLIKVFDSLSDPEPVIFADLRTNVHNNWDRGLLGLALDPNFPSNPYVYVFYTHDAEIGGTAPRWGLPEAESDPCPDSNNVGCVASGRLSRLQASGNAMTGTEKVLIEDWFIQYPSHSIGTLLFGPDGALYASGGDGASYNFVDYGQTGNPLNPAGDPPVGIGQLQRPPTAEGGTLRSQDLRTTTGIDPVSLDGTVIRVDPATGNALPGNPLFNHSDPNARRIIAYGLRNPFRMTFRPGTSEIWVADVGWQEWEEINRIVSPLAGGVKNFGWPCFEGPRRQFAYAATNLNICNQLYNEPEAVTNPYYAHYHGGPVAPGESVPGFSSATSGIAFYNSGNYPSNYHGALFFANAPRNRIYVMFKGSNGDPDPANCAIFVANAPTPVDLQIGPEGDLFYVDLLGGAIHRIQYFVNNQPPVAVVRADKVSGDAPLTVNFDGTGSSDPDPGDTLSYGWDFNTDGVDDSTEARPTHTFNKVGSTTVSLRVSDRQKLTATASIVISVGNNEPTAILDTPLPSLMWQVGETISFSGRGVDKQDGNLSPSSLYWSVVINHCIAENDCHQHPFQTFPGVASGSFIAPDHEYPSHLEMSLTATDMNGLKHTQSLKLHPKPVALNFETHPAGLQIALNSSVASAPFNRQVIIGSTNSISAPSPQVVNGIAFEFESWSDGGGQAHNITAGSASATYSAKFKNKGSRSRSGRPRHPARPQPRPVIN